MKNLTYACLLLVGVFLRAADRPPEIRDRVPPIYPPWLRGPEVGEGEVIVRFRVTKTGSTTDVVAIKSPHRLLSRAAEAAVRQWKFKPGTRDGAPAEFPVQVPIIFQMEGFLGERYLDGRFGCVNGADGAELPALSTATSIAYPGKHWRKGADGAVTAEFIVTAEGRVAEVKILSASQPEFGESVAKALPAFRFDMDPTYVGTPRVRLELEFMSAATQSRKAKEAKEAAAKSAEKAGR